MDMLKIGQIVKHPTIGIGIVTDVMRCRRRPIYIILSDIFNSRFGWKSDDKISAYWKISCFITVLSSDGLEHVDWMEDWNSLTKDELDAYFKQKGTLVELGTCRQ